MDYLGVMSNAFQDELRKIASEKRALDTTGLAGKALKTVKSPWFYMPAAGIAGWETLKRVDRDRRLGRQMRMQARGRY